MSDDLWTGLADLAPDERLGDGSGGAFVRVFAIAGSEYEFAFAARRLLADEGLSVVAIDEIAIVDDVAALAEDDREAARVVIESGTAGRADTFHAYPEVDEQ